MEDTLLIVDDQADLLYGLERTIRPEIDCRILLASNGAAALESVKTEGVDMVLADIRMPEMDGLTLLQAVKAFDPAITVVVMTAYGTIEHAVEAIKAGAYDFIQKPIDTVRMLHLVKKGLELNRLVRENRRLLDQLQEQKPFADIVGSSPPVLRAIEKIRMLARSSATVLILGETGTGKNLAARAIHASSRRGNCGMVTVNCPALPENILESELFGYLKGAFTNASEDRQGLFDAARGSTIFLDEIGDLSIAVQTKLLKVLDEKQIKPLGANTSHEVDVRILAATNQDLEKKIESRLFREDLYYRLNVATLTMPPLRTIREDIPLLVEHFLQTVAAREKQPAKTVATEVMNWLLARDWPGNTRELENMIRGWYALTMDAIIEPRHLPATAAALLNPEGPQIFDRPYKDLKSKAIREFTLQYLQRLLAHTEGNVTLSAKLSGIQRQSLQKIIKRYGINIHRYRNTA